MPDVTFYHRLTTTTQRWPALHRPLKSGRTFLTGTIPRVLVNILRTITPRTNFRIGPPKNIFPIRPYLSDKNFQPNRLVLTNQGAPKLNELQIISKMRQNEWQPWPIFWSMHKNARLVASSLALLDRRKRLCLESAYNDVCIKDDPAWNYCRLPQEVFLKGNWTSIVSRWCPNDGVPTFSHWLNDALPRLALLKEFPPDTQILVPCKLAAYQKETLQLLGVLDRIRYTPERHLIIENYFFSAPTSMISCYNPYAINWMRSVFLGKADKSYKGPKRFIIQRKGKTRGIKNEAEVNDFFQKLGWKIIDTEKMTFAQEIELFSNAEAFAGVLGSGFTNATWSSPGTKVITFIADNWIDGWVEWIADVNKLDYFWKIFPADAAMMIEVDLDEVKKILVRANLL